MKLVKQVAMDAILPPEELKKKLEKRTQKF
jgi:hypothetical protein